MLEIVIKVFILLVMVGAEVMGISLLEGNVIAGIVLMATGIVGIIVILFLLLRRRVHPARLKVNELSWWHIERPEPEHHGWAHCHEYNFAGEIEIIPRFETSVKAFYLELPLGNEVIEVKLSSPLTLIPEITPSEKITRDFSFQIRLEREIKIPPFAYVIMKFKHGKPSKRRVALKADADYRFKRRLGEQAE